MSGLGGGGKKTQTQTSTTAIDPRIADQQDYAMSQVRGAYEGGFSPYEGERYAGFSPDQLQAQQAVRNLQGQGQNVYSEAQGYTPQTVQAQKLTDVDLKAYQNPFQENVIDRGISSMDRARQIALESESARASQGGSINNARFGLQRGAINTDFVRNVGDFVADKQAQNYNQAMGYASQDINRQFQGDQFNVGAGMQGQQLNLQGANLARQAGYQDAQALGQQGMQQMALDQAQKDFDYQQYIQGTPEHRIQMLMPLLGVQGGQTTTQSNPIYKNVLGQMLGGATTGASIGAMSGAGPVGAGIGAGVGAGASLLM